MLQATKPGDAATVAFTRDGKPQTATVTLGSADGRTQGVLGVVLAVLPTAGLVQVDLGGVGGPSAGLMFSLGIVDKLTPGELTGGRFVAGTGAIDAEGVVSNIGGIQFKMAAARAAGATVFLLPAGECAEAVAAVPAGLQLIKVGTLHDAVTALDDLNAGRTPPAARRIGQFGHSRPEREPHSTSVELDVQYADRREVVRRRKPNTGACPVAMRPPVGAPTLSRRTRILLIVAAVVVLLLLGGSRLLNLYVDWLWFGEAGFRSVFTTVLFTHVLLFVIGGLVMGGLVALSLWIAYRSRPVFVPVSGPEDPIARYRTVMIQRLRLFGIGIPVVIGFITGLAVQGDWQTVQMFLNSTPFGVTDPVFNIDVSFYTFQLPFFRSVLDLAVRRHRDQLRGRADHPLRVRRHPAHRPRRPGQRGGPRPARGAGGHVRAAQGRGVLLRPLRAAVLRRVARTTSPAPPTPTSTR